MSHSAAKHSCCYYYCCCGYCCYSKPWCRQHIFFCFHAFPKREIIFMSSIWSNRFYTKNKNKTNAFSACYINSRSAKTATKTTHKMRNIFWMNDSESLREREVRLLNNSNLNNCCRLYCLLLFGLKGLLLDPYGIPLWRKLNINDFQLISSHFDFVKAFCDKLIKYTILIPLLFMMNSPSKVCFMHWASNEVSESLDSFEFKPIFEEEKK